MSDEGSILDDVGAIAGVAAGIALLPIFGTLWAIDSLRDHKALRQKENIKQTRKLWDEVNQLITRVPDELALDTVTVCVQAAYDKLELEEPPTTEVVSCFVELVEYLAALDGLGGPLKIDWSKVKHLGVAEGVRLRNYMRMQTRILEDYDHAHEIWRVAIYDFMCDVFDSLPDYLFNEEDSEESNSATVPFINFLRNPEYVVGSVFNRFLYNDEAKEAGVFSVIQAQLLVSLHPSDKRPLPLPPIGDDPAELLSTYLGGTLFEEFFNVEMPFEIPEKTRFEHQWIVAGSGHGKTQTIQSLVLQDLEKVKEGEASIVVMDSQGDLIRNISHLKVFAKGGELHDKLVLIDPTDVEYPVCLNLFDVNMERINKYSMLDRERMVNGILELYDFVLGSLLSAELTQKQSVIFRYITRLMLHIPDATIHTFRELMEPDGYEKYREHISKLTGTARAFFDTEFTSKQFADTKRQVVRRLWGILENQSFERMFSHPRNKVDMFTEMNAGKVILVNTAKDLLKETGTQIFGRFFIAMIAQAAQERATLKKRLPVYVYVDECQDYVDENMSLILDQARKFNVGMILAHQYIGQLPPKVLGSFEANTSIKFAGGVSSRDARAFAPMMNTTPAFIEKQRKGHFAAYIRNTTSSAMSLGFPFGVLEKEEKMTSAEHTALVEAMRSKYAVHHTEATKAASASLPPEEPFEPPDEVSAEPTPWGKSEVIEGEWKEVKENKD